MILKYIKMIYNEINKSLVTLSNEGRTFKDGVIRTIFYDGGVLQIAEKNRYVEIDGIETNQFGKKQITVKSKVLSKMILDIVDSVKTNITSTITDPVMSDGSFRVTVNKYTRFTSIHNRTRYVGNLENSKFDACLSINVTSIYTGNDKTSFQILANEIVVTNVRESNLEIDMDKLCVSEY